MRLGRIALCAAMVITSAAACTSTQPSDGSATTLPTVPPTAPVTPPVDPAVLGLPDSPPGRQLTWVLTALTEATVDDVATHFDPSFLARVPASDIVPVLQRLGSPTVISRDRITETSISVVVRGESPTPLRVTLCVDPSPGGQIVDLSITEPTAPPTSWAGIRALADAVAPSVSMLAADVEPDGSLSPWLHANEDDSLAVGPAASIYVLGMLTDRIAGGDLGWSDTLTVTDANRSQPDGLVRLEPTGSTFTIADAATAMIAHDDSSAFDMLIDVVGRDLIEGLMPSMGSGEVSQAMTFPLLSTRQAFQLRTAVDDATRSRYAGADANEREALLGDLPAALPLLDGVDLSRPVATQSIGWFASATELARAHLWLHSQRGLPGQEPLEAVLAGNSGLELDREQWPAISFVRGAHAGVLSLSWLLTRDDGRQFVVALIANNPSDTIDELAMHSIAVGVTGLFAAA